MNSIWKDFRVMVVEKLEDSRLYEAVLVAADGQTVSVQCELADVPYDGNVQVPYYWAGGNLLNFAAYKFTNAVNLPSPPTFIVDDIWPENSSNAKTF